MPPKTSNWNETDPEDVRRGATIQELRVAYGVTVDELAARLGISSRYLQYIESGHRRPKAEIYGQIAGILGVRLAAITIDGFKPLDGPLAVAV
jgi:transcriptional regulator with XRE-family HTH domain